MKNTNKIKNQTKKVIVYIAGIAVTTIGLIGQASAAVDLTGVTLDTTTPETLAATVLAGLGVIWGIRKLVKLTNRS